MTVSHLKLNLTNMVATSSLTVFCNLKDPALPQNLLYLHHTQGISNHPEVPQRVCGGDSSVRITYSRIINPVTYFTSILLHSFKIYNIIYMLSGAKILT